MAKRYTQRRVERGAVVNVVHPRGGYKFKRAIVVGVVKPDSFSRAYGKQVYVCDARTGSVSEVGAGDAIPVGKTKRIPVACRAALTDYKQTYAPDPIAPSTRGRIEPSTVGTGTWLVKVDAGELRVKSGKKLPYPTTVGTINKRGTINVWTPAASVPRGYKAAARAVLEAARDELCAAGKVEGKCKR